MNIKLDFYGGFGNNLQQIALAIMYCKKYKNNLIVNNHNLINNFKFIQNNSFKRFLKPANKFRMFYFGSMQNPNFMIDHPINKKDFDFYNNNFHSTLKENIRPNVSFIKNIKLDNDLLVVHIRNMEGHPDYVQNPIGYYKKIFERYEKILIVTDNPNSPLINKLKTLKKLEIQSSSLQNDFNTLLSTSNLVTSGVGTFSMAAAMMSNNLKNFYYSNFYLDRHLNPSMLSNEIKKNKLTIRDYMGFGEWKKKESEIYKVLYSDFKIDINF